MPAVGVLGFGVVGLGLAAVVPLAWSAAARMSPDSPGRAISAVAACGYLGFLTGPAVIGAIASTVGLRVALLCVIVFVAATYALGSHTRTVESSPARSVRPWNPPFTRTSRTTGGCGVDWHGQRARW